MKKLLGAVALVGLILAFQPVEQVQAEHTAEAIAAGCPSGDAWFEAPSFFVLPAIDKGNFKDQNGDGLLCFRVPKGFCNNRGMGANAPVCGAWVWKDNVNSAWEWADNTN